MQRFVLRAVQDLREGDLVELPGSMDVLRIRDLEVIPRSLRRQLRLYLESLDGRERVSIVRREGEQLRAVELSADE